MSHPWWVTWLVIAGLAGWALYVVALIVGEIYYSWWPWRRK